jgi:low temperature requirement protein LtrA
VGLSDDRDEPGGQNAPIAESISLLDQVARRRISYGLRTWFRTSPRRHGEVIASREVSFLELFYDLVFVVLIGRMTHHLAEHVTGRSVIEFAVVFGLVWLAWFNGTLWHELHGREDGRSRNYIFMQMGLLALLAVFAAGAAGEDGQGFAIVYSILFALLTWQWWQVHRVDTDRRYRPMTTRYLAAMVITAVVMAASAFVEPDGRVAVWAVVIVCWFVGSYVWISTDHTEGFGEGVTASLVERMACSPSSCSASWSSVSWEASATPSNATRPPSSPASSG